MATYVFRCGADGSFEVSLPMGTAGSSAPCPACEQPAGRVLTAPLLSRGDRRVKAAIERTERSASDPEVVTALPPRAGRRRTKAVAANPALRRLPRP